MASVSMLVCRVDCSSWSVVLPVVGPEWRGAANQSSPRREDKRPTHDTHAALRRLKVDLPNDLYDAPAQFNAASLVMHRLNAPDFAGEVGDPLDGHLARQLPFHVELHFVAGANRRHTSPDIALHIALSAKPSQGLGVDQN